MSFLYLASPYSSPVEGRKATLNDMEARYLATKKELYFFIRAGYPVYSPIVHCHEMAKRFDLPKDATFWKRYNHAFLTSAAGIIVCGLDDWNESAGVKDEIEFAKTHWMPYWFHQPERETIGEAFDAWARTSLAHR